MRISDIMKRIMVILLRIKPKVFSPEEKEETRQKMIEENRKQNRDVFSCDKDLIDGLNIKKISLSDCDAWLIHRDGNPDDRIVYYIHGGGFVNSCTRLRMRFVSYIANNFHYNVFSIDYRLAPEYMFPCALNDCLEGYEPLLKDYKSENIVFVGESAGGNLILSLALLLKEKGLPQPAAIYSNSPATQLAEYTDSYRKYSLKRDFIVAEGIIENMEGIYFNREDVRNPYVSPLYGDLKDLPPVWLSASNCECLLDDSIMMYEKLKDAGNDTILQTYDDLCHAFIISPQMKEVVKNVYPDFKAFLNQYLG